MNFESDLQFGEEYERLAAEKVGRAYGCTFKKVSHIGNNFDCISEHGVKMEVKTDRMWKDTGNVAIEVTNGGNASGVAATDATTVAYVLYPETHVYYCLTRVLRERIEKYRTAYIGEWDRDWET